MNELINSPVVGGCYLVAYLAWENSLKTKLITVKLLSKKHDIYNYSLGKLSTIYFLMKKASPRT